MLRTFSRRNRSTPLAWAQRSTKTFLKLAEFVISHQQSTGGLAVGQRGNQFRIWGVVGQVRDLINPFQQRPNTH